MSKIKCSICGSKEVTMIDHTNKYAFCYKCMPDVVYKDGFEFRKTCGCLAKEHQKGQGGIQSEFKNISNILKTELI